MTTDLATFYLPVTQDQAEAFLAEGQVPDLVVERAALYAMVLACQQGRRSPGTLARSVAEADQAFASITPAQVHAFMLDRRADIAPENTAGLLDELAAAGIVFASEAHMASRAWCAGSGRYSEAFQDHCRDTLVPFSVRLEYPPSAWNADEGTDDEAAVPARSYRVTLHGTTDQARAAQAVAAAPDEHFALDAYAGSGKTHLLLALAAGGGRYTHIAPTQAHHYAFRQRSGTAGIVSITQWELAHRMAEALARQLATRASTRAPRVRDSTLSLQQQAQMAAIPSIAGAAPERVLLRLLETIRRWCNTDQPTFAAEDFHRLEVAPQDSAAYVALAERVWRLMFSSIQDKSGQLFTIKLYHLVKWLHVEGAQIPQQGTLLVDEAHDLQAPWRALLDRYSEGWVLMGDPYQRLSGPAPRSGYAKSLTMTQSVRTGEHAMPLIRSVLDLHSERLLGDPLAGSRDHVTRTRAYRPAELLPDTGLRVYGTEWKLLEDALRLKDAGAPFRFIPASAKTLEQSVTDALGLRLYGEPPRQYHLRAFKTWELFATHLSELGQARIIRLFERAFARSDLKQLFASAAPPESDGVTLGLLQHCKNLESSTVVMSECCFTRPSKVALIEGGDPLVKAVYVAMTRVRDELWLPGDAKDRLTDAMRQAIAPT